MDSVGGGVVADIFRDPYSVGGVVAELFSLTAVTYLNSCHASMYCVLSE